MHAAPRRFIALFLMFFAGSGCAKRNTDPIPSMQVRFDNLTSTSERLARAGAMRQFLWEHWRAKQPAIVRAEHISKEGKQTDVLFQIRLVFPSTLLLTTTYTRYRYGYNGQVFKHDEQLDDVYTVERISRTGACPSDVTEKVTVLPDTEVHPGSDYCLRFIGWGSEVKRFL